MQAFTEDWGLIINCPNAFSLEMISFKLKIMFETLGHYFNVLSELIRGYSEVGFVKRFCVFSICIAMDYALILWSFRDFEGSAVRSLHGGVVADDQGSSVF